MRKCKHEGGTDQCVRNTRRECIVRKNAYNLGYSAVNNRSGSSDRASCSNRGEAAELFVGADLLHRGLEVTKPLNRTGADDLHVRVSAGWKKIQVKVGKVHIRTGNITMGGGGIGNNKKAMTSDVLALVDLISRRIRYEALHGAMPPELL